MVRVPDPADQPEEVVVAEVAEVVEVVGAAEVSEVESPAVPQEGEEVLWDPVGALASVAWAEEQVEPNTKQVVVGIEIGFYYSFFPLI